MSAFANKMVDLDPFLYFRLDDKVTSLDTLAAREHGEGTVQFKGTVLNNQANYAGADGTAIATDADDDFALVTGMWDEVMHGSHSVAFWVMETVRLAGDNNLVGAGSAATNAGLHLVIRNGALHQGFYSNDLPGPAINTGQWYFIVMQYTGAEQQIYVDGVRVATRATTTGYTGTSNNMRIGHNTFANAQGSRMRMSEFAIFDRALTDAEVAALYDSRNNPANTPQKYRDVVLADAPYLYYPLDSSPTDPQDLSGNALHGTAGSNVTLSSRLMREGGQGVRLGSGEIAPPQVLAFADQPITIEFWAKKHTHLQQNSVINFNVGGTRTALVHLGWTDGAIYWDAGHDGTNFDRIAKVRDFDLGEVHHYVFVKDQAAGVMQIWVDGVLWHFGGGMTRPMRNTDTTRIGTTFDGWIDEFAVYRKRLTGAQIHAHYLAGRTYYEGELAKTELVPPGPAREILFSVPPGVNELTVDMAGAQSGTPAQPMTEALGGRVTGKIPVSAGEVLAILPGEAGRSGYQGAAADRGFGGFDDGGNAGSAGGTAPLYGIGNGAGGASEISRGFRDEFSRTVLGSDWTFRNYSNVLTPSIDLNGNRLAVTAGGDFWTTADDAALVQRPTDGAQYFQVELPGKPSGAYTRTLQLRAENVFNSPFYAVTSDGDNNGWTIVYRAVTGGDAVVMGQDLAPMPGSGPIWLRITRSPSNVVQAWSSLDGRRWKAFGAVQFAGDLVWNLIGLGSNGGHTATYDNFRAGKILAIAGGGGAHGSNSGTGQPAGHGGGLTGGSAGGSLASTGGTQTAGGANGGGENGVFLRGGNGASSSDASGGGGGGGWFGGGGSGAQSIGGSGGGGSSYTDPSVTSVVHTQGYKRNHGKVLLTYPAKARRRRSSMIV